MSKFTAQEVPRSLYSGPQVAGIGEVQRIVQAVNKDGNLELVAELDDAGYGYRTIDETRGLATIAKIPVALIVETEAE